MPLKLHVSVVLPGVHVMLNVSLFLLLLGPHLTHVSVLQYGSINTIDISWNEAQEKAHLLSLVDLMQREGGPSQIGNAGWGHKLAVEPAFSS